MQPFWQTIIRPCLDLLKPQIIIEIGTDAAQTTRLVAGFARTYGATVHTIDPEPAIDMAALATEFEPHLVCHRAQSLEALPTLPGADCVLIDGDHNWYTVKHELEIIAKSAALHDRMPIVFMHDIAWPYARRDLYYEPERIPAIHRQPWKTAPIDPATDALGETGFNRNHHHAVYAHGIRNGVLSAVEDFLADHPGWTFATIPGFSGLGILAPDSLYERFPALRACVEHFARAVSVVQDHIEALERTRISGIIAEERLATSLWNLDNRDAQIRAQQIDADRLSGELNRMHQHMQTQEEHANLLSAELNRMHQHAGMQQTNSIRLSAQIKRMHEHTKTQQEHADLLSAELNRMRRTRSWRITEPLRRMEAFLRGRHRKESRQTGIKSIWHALGEPFPGTARYIRHKLLGRIWPAKAHDPAAAVSGHLPAVAVVIPCHNYGAFLREAVESVLAQTHAPTEIVIVDDASTDDTQTVARSFAGRGVRTIRGEWHNVGAARNAGLDATRSRYVVFLDADDMLHPEYLRCGLRALESDSAAGIAYTDHQFFGRRKYYHKTPAAFDWEIFDTTNVINAAAMVRREALLQAGGWSLETGQHADWITWRRILRLRWRALHSDGLLYYRVHGGSMTDSMNEDASYVEQAGFMTEQTTLCLSLSGRAWAWPLMRAFLETQTFPHALTHLIILDTSQDAAFAAGVRAWLSRCDYAGITYRSMDVGRKGLADAPREDVAREIGTACSTIYNTFGRMVETPLAFILEDDVIPPTDAFPRLIRSFAPNVVSVSGFYRHRDKPRPVCWEWDARGFPVFPEPSIGVQPIGGTGFGCLAIRGEFMRRHVFQSGEPFGNYDHNFFASLTRDAGYAALIDWDCVCRHYQSPDVWF